MTKNINEIGWKIIGNPDGNTNLTKQEFDELGVIFRERSRKYTEKQKQAFEMVAVFSAINSYIDEPIKSGKILAPGHFIKELLKIYKLKNKDLADQLGLTKSNFSALINGKRKINFDLAIKLGKIFGIKPKLWLDVQNKNELWRLENADKEKYKKYTLENLLKA
ncbi:MAG TPA: addiction module antidote protein, HigA family [Bacteroidetes bacterium]|nr:addiction module antidote protein, HigA family [Bacteroidota bacterium]